MVDDFCLNEQLTVDGLPYFEYNVPRRMPWFLHIG